MAFTNTNDSGGLFINGYAARGPGFNSASAFHARGNGDLSGEAMQGLSRFDRKFFGMSVNEAQYTDPQVRFLLEVTYEALVDAGVVDFELLKLLSVGVYVGSSFADFHSAALKDPKTITGYEHLGAAGAMLANMISRVFRFTGPSMKVDTACSSSLVAFDLVRECVA